VFLGEGGRERGRSEAVEAGEAMGKEGRGSDVVTSSTCSSPAR
jgi:hypothetical protein